MSGNASEDKSAELRRHPDYQRAIRAYSAEEDDRVKTVLLRRFQESLPEDMDEIVAEIVEDSEVIDTPQGSCGWRYCYQGEALMIGLIQLNGDKSGVIYGFQEA